MRAWLFAFGRGLAPMLATLLRRQGAHRIQRRKLSSISEQLRMNVLPQYYSAMPVSAEETSTNVPTRILDADAGPLVWIDLEMTGLDPKKDEIMEIAVCIDVL